MDTLERLEQSLGDVKEENAALKEDRAELQRDLKRVLKGRSSLQSLRNLLLGEGQAHKPTNTPGRRRSSIHPQTSASHIVVPRWPIS